MQPLFMNTPLVWKDRYEFDYEKIMPVIQETFSLCGERKVRKVFLENGEACSTASLCTDSPNKQPHLRKENWEFLDWLHPRLRNIMNAWEYPLEIPYYIYNSWYNSHYKTGETLEHNHSLSHLVVSCYIKVPENSGNIMFRDPLHDIRAMEPRTNGSYPWKELQVNTGDVVVFPGWLWHKVQPSNSDEERIVWTINVKVDEQMLSGGYLSAMRDGVFYSRLDVLR